MICAKTAPFGYVETLQGQSERNASEKMAFTVRIPQLPPLKGRTDSRSDESMRDYRTNYLWPAVRLLGGEGDQPSLVFRMVFYFVKIFPHRPKNQNRALRTFGEVHM
jgi:hypothetical protein